METINFKDLYKETKLTESVVMFNDTKIKVKQYLDYNNFFRVYKEELFMETINFKDLYKETKLTESVVMFNDTKIKVKQYLDLDSKKNIIDFALQGGKTPKFINRLNLL